MKRIFLFAMLLTAPAVANEDAALVRNINTWPKAERCATACGFYHADQCVHDGPGDWPSPATWREQWELAAKHGEHTKNCTMYDVNKWYDAQREKAGREIVRDFVAGICAELSSYPRSDAYAYTNARDCGPAPARVDH